MKKRKDTDQLLLDFDRAKENFREASDALINSFVELQASSTSVETKSFASKALKNENLILRKKINDIVKVKARNTRFHWREIWNIAYDRLRRKTGFDAVSRGIAKGVIPLDAACSAGYGFVLLDIVQGV